MSGFIKEMPEQKQITLLKYNRNTYYIRMNKFLIICYELLMFSHTTKRKRRKDNNKKQRNKTNFFHKILQPHIC